MTEQELLKKDGIIKDIQSKLVLLRNALIEERKKASSFDEKNKELNNQINDLERVVKLKEEEIANLTRDMVDLQESISLEKNKNEDASVKNVFKSVSHIFQKEGNNVTEDENKKLQTTINDLKDVNEKIKKENEELKKKLEELKNSSSNKINDLTTKNKKMEENILNINKKIDDYMKNIENMILSDVEFKNEKKNLEKTNIDLEKENKIYKEEIEKKKIENNRQKERINTLKEKIKKTNEENIGLIVKMKRTSDAIGEFSTRIQQFKCEKKGKINSKCEIFFGPTEDHQYIMLVKNDNKSNEKILLENIEYLKLNSKEKIIEVSLMKNGSCQRYQLTSNQSDILEKIVETYQDYYNSVMRVKNGLTNII